MGTLTQRIRHVLRKPPPPRPSKKVSAVETYLAGGRMPFSEGYTVYREELLRATFADAELMERFRQGDPLPPDYGARMDERVVEYPWVLSRLGNHPNRLLDAGATLIFPFLLELPLLQTKSIVICTLAPEKWVHQRANVSYLYGDLRETILKDALFQEIVCLSTLDHVGMDNTIIYSDDSRFREASPREYRRVVQELRRLLTPGGRLLITVPYGRYENLGWMQQFDAAQLQDLIESFGGRVAEKTYYKYYATGWQVAEAEDCATSEYFDIHRTPEIQADGAAAARAVACIEFVRD